MRSIEASKQGLASLILDLSKEYDPDRVNGDFTILELTNVEIAQSIGSTPETVSKSLGRLIKRELISHKRGRIILQHEEDLRDFVANSL
jgi:CRP-like cAMP-binding protein